MGNSNNTMTNSTGSTAVVQDNFCETAAQGGILFVKITTKRTFRLNYHYKKISDFNKSTCLWSQLVQTYFSFFSSPTPFYPNLHYLINFRQMETVDFLLLQRDD